MSSPALNINGVTCTIAHIDDEPGIIRSWPESGPQVMVRFLVDWGSAPALASALMGYVTIDGDGSIARIPPYALPWAPQLYCTNVSDELPLTPIGGIDGWTRFGESIITATFSALRYQIADNDPSGRVDASGLSYTTTKFRVSTEIYSPPNGAYYIDPFGSSAVPLNQGSVGFVRPQVEVNMVRKWRVFLPLQESILLVGCVNDEAITLANFTFPRGCLLFNGMESDPTNDPNGFPVFDVSFNFSGHESAEWNQIVGDDGDFHYLNTKQDGTGDPPFAYSDFSALFTD